MAKVKETYQRKLVNELRHRRERLIEGLRVAMSDDDPEFGKGLGREDFAQLTEGMLSVIDEGLQGRSAERRTFFVETVVPGLMARGATPGEVETVMRRWTGGMAGAVTEDLEPATDQRQAMAWMDAFFSGLVDEMRNVAQPQGGGR